MNGPVEPVDVQALKATNSIYKNLASTIESPQIDYSPIEKENIKTITVSPPRDKVEDKIKYAYSGKTVKSKKKKSISSSSNIKNLVPEKVDIQDSMKSNPEKDPFLEIEILQLPAKKMHNEMFWKLKSTIKAHLDSVTNFAMHPTLLSAVTVSDDGTSKVWNLSALSDKRFYSILNINHKILWGY